ncbi:hypothetical protein ACLB2K_061394 [Fragaria x ananassa]
MIVHGEHAPPTTPTTMGSEDQEIKAGDVHRVKYYEDTEFFIKWDGKWDMFFDEDLEAAKKAIDQELENGGE